MADAAPVAPSRVVPVLLPDLPAAPALVAGSVEQPAPFDQPGLLAYLCARARVHLALSPRRRRRAARVIALLGRYGQGKSSILGAFEHELRSSGRCLIDPLDVSRFKPDDIQYSFESLVAPRLLLPHFLLLLVTLAALLAGLWHLWPIVPDNLRSFFSAASVLASLGVALTAAALGAHSLAQSLGLFATAVWGDLSRHWTARVLTLLREPDVILVDNLDRASVEQQKALLRSIMRVRHILGSLVVVAMDQTRLIDGSQDPEGAPELLRKVFDVQLQMPPMTAADARSIVKAVFAEAIRLNLDGAPGQTWMGPILESPLVQGDFARIVLLHRQHSQRFPRRLLNNALSAAHVLGIGSPLAFSALLRLLGLFEHLPSLQHDPTAIAALMRADDGAGLVAHAAQLNGRPIPEDRSEAVQRYIAGTCHIHPDFADWQAFTGRFGGREPAHVADAWSPRFTGEDAAKLMDKWLKLDLDLAERLNHPGDRLAAFRNADDNFRQEPAGENRMSWLFLSRRLWIADEAVHRRMEDESRRRMLHFDDVRPNATAELTASMVTAFLRLLPNTPVGSYTLAQAALFVATPEIGIRPVTDALRIWLDGARREVPALDDLHLTVFGSCRLRPIETSSLEVAWPATGLTREDAICHIGTVRLLFAHDCCGPTAGAAVAIGELTWGHEANDTDRHGVLRLWAETCPDFAEDGFGIWKTELTVRLWEEVCALAQRTSTTRGFAARTAAAFARWGELPKLRLPGFFVLAVVVDRLRRSAAAEPGSKLRLPLGDDLAGDLLTELYTVISGLAYDLRPPGDAWDLGYVDSLSRLPTNALFEPDFVRLEALRRLWIPLAKRLAESPERIRFELGCRLLGLLGSPVTIPAVDPEPIM